MKNKSTVLTKKINSAYVFSENDQVYIKYDTSSQSRSNDILHSAKWVPVSFYWKP
ncbi:hypothetical protein [Aquimarina sp. AU474]|uniref:hypothetical protein n=1 Tax=Aquimarina sp. AU474 TaxID=2108529 RepID=UPI0013574713|nr:hypothetical protein [Aquimarina sp. AU474]